MQIVKTIKELRDSRSAMSGDVAFVPTMGNLHAGHLSLITAAQQYCDQVVVSIFVNPMQFDEQADLDAYPRTLEEDVQKLQTAGVELLFLPNNEVIYPVTSAQHTRVEVPNIGDILEGEYRPGHFTGVATVVCKLLNLVQADVAVFGKKDFQQLMLIRKMVDDMAMHVRIIGLDTLRENDGLAMSSRNSHLNDEQRQIAPWLNKILTAVAIKLEAGNQDFSLLENMANKDLQTAGFVAEYFSVRAANDLQLANADTQELVVLAAARLGDTRLIDNKEVHLQNKVKT